MGQGVGEIPVVRHNITGAAANGLQNSGITHTRGAQQQLYSFNLSHVSRPGEGGGRGAAKGGESVGRASTVGLTRSHAAGLITISIYIEIIFVNNIR